jgi:hypothetical protein
MRARLPTRTPTAGKPPDRIFPWKNLDGPQLPKWVAVALVAGIFAFCLTTIRVQIVRPAPWLDQKATIMFVPPGPEGRMWELQSRERGPFPSRFDPSEWTEAGAMEEILQATLREPDPAYVPPLRDLPAAEPLAAVPLAQPGRQFFPDRKPPPRPNRPTGTTRPTPALYPLSGIRPEDMPRELPHYEVAGNAVPSGIPWRFLIRLHPDGSVAESVSLVGPEAPGLESLDDWLRRIRFPATDDHTGERWIGIAAGFTNQAADGPDPR